MRRLFCRSVQIVSAVLLGASAVQAQSHGEKIGPDGEPVALTEQESRRRRGFALFGAADVAESSIRTPSLYIMTLSNTGNLDFARRLMMNRTDPVLRPFDASFANARINNFTIAWGTPPSERAKIMAAAGPRGAGLSAALGRGYNWIATGIVATQGDNLQPSDNQLGPVLKGVQSTADRSCRDHRGNAWPISGNFFLPAGTPLLPGSDCPETWGSLGWQGRRPVAQDVFLNAARSNAANFRFDSWKFPEHAPDPAAKPDRQYGNFQTYGTFSDYNKDDLCGAGSQRTFGRVVRNTLRGGHCADVPPTKEGYPLGLEARVDAFNYGLPALQDVAWYEILITNNSADLYGVGIDYDSLYISFVSGLQANSQQTPVYYRPEDGGTYWTGTCSQQPGPKGRCNGAASATDITVVRATPPSSGSAWQLGSAVILVLKSPIGDLRNKLFSRPSSPFSQLAGVPATLKDDTITFNHGHHCGFRACAARQVRDVIGLSPDYPQRAFGMVSSIEKHVIGDNASLSDAAFQSGATNLWHIFRSADFPSNGGSVGPGPNQFPQRGGFNRWVPGAAGGVGAWDYNNDGVSDTLYYDTCTSKAGGTTLASSCAALWSDTMPHSPGLPALINGYANSMQITGVGPIKLKSRDTVSFVVAVTAGCCGPAKADSSALAAKVNAAINHYLNFYLAPDVLPRDTIAAVDVIGGNYGTAKVTLTFTETAERAADPFLLSTANAAAAPAPGTADERLLKLNPFLADSLRLYALPFGTPVRRYVDPPTAAPSLTAIGNFAELYIFKSCDNGATYTATANCEPARSVSGPFAQLGWLPYATLKRDDTGEFSNTFTDVNVNGGSTYTYVLVARSRGPTLNLLTGDAIDSVPKAGGGYTYFCKTNCSTQPVNFAPALFNPIASSGPNVATVYVPTSGSARPLITVSRTAGPVPASRVVITNQSRTPRPGTYTIQFFDSVNVTMVDSLDPDQKARFKTTTTVVGYKGTVPTTFTSTALGGPGMAGAIPRTTTVASVTGGSIRTATFHFGAASTGLKAIVSLESEAILVTNRLNATATPETFFSSAAFPGFTIAFTDDPPLAYNTAVGEQVVDASGRTIGPLVLPMVRINTTTLQVNTAANTAQGGKYTFTWGAKPFGPGEPFRLDLANPANTQTAFTNSVTQRAAVDTAEVSDALAIAAFGAGFTADSLVAAKLPFTIRNESFDRPVVAVMRKRPVAARQRLLGEGRDTLTVQVPQDVWLPGDTLVLFETVAEGGPLVRTVNRIVLECTLSRAGRPTCNPLALLSPGTGGLNGNVWITTEPGTKQSILINPALSTAQQFTFTVAPAMAGATLASSCVRNTDAGCQQIKGDLRKVRVVPNPYLGFSQYNDPTTTANQLFRPLLFSGVPPRGILRIYTVSGQLVQQIKWTEADLNGTNDLLWNLRTRENTLVAGGLYMAVITAQNQTDGVIGSRMVKFVVIR